MTLTGWVMVVVRDSHESESGTKYLTFTRVIQGARDAVHDIHQVESGWEYVKLTRVSQGGST